MVLKRGEFYSVHENNVASFLALPVQVQQIITIKLNGAVNFWPTLLE